MTNRASLLSAVAVVLMLVCLPSLARAKAASKSAAIAKELVQLMDSKKLDSIAARIGLPASEVFGKHPPVPEALVAHFQKRGQYTADPEGDERIPEMDVMMQEDLWRLRADA